MRKQSIKKGIWKIGGRKRQRQREEFFPLAALAGPVLGGIPSNLARPLLKIYLAVEKTPTTTMILLQCLEIIFCCVDVLLPKK